jgi:hypothetical protein
MAQSSIFPFSAQARNRRDNVDRIAEISQLEDTMHVNMDEANSNLSEIGELA